MASGIVRSFIGEFCDLPGWRVVESLLKQFAPYTNGDASMDAFDEFSEELVRKYSKFEGVLQVYLHKERETLV